MTTDIQDSQLLFLGRKAEELSNLIETQIAPVFRDLGIQIPIRSCSVMTVIKHRGAASAADIAKQLGQSHQLVKQKLPTLLRLKLVQERSDPDDRRRKLLSLTAQGVRQVALLEQQSLLVEQAYAELHQELGVDLHQALSDAIAALGRAPLEQRIRNP